MFEHSFDLTFATLLRNKPLPSSLIVIFQKAYKRNRNFFRVIPKKFNIVVCDTETEYKKFASYYYHKKQTAVVLKNGTIVTRSPEFIAKLKWWKKKDFQKLMIHEINHVFWISLYKTTNIIWLAEGLASHIGDNFIFSKHDLRQILKKYSVSSSILDYRYLKRNFKSGHLPRYPLWANFTRFLIKRYGQEKLFNFLSCYNSLQNKEQYLKCFLSTYGLSVPNMFEMFIEKIEI